MNMDYASNLALGCAMNEQNEKVGVVPPLNPKLEANRKKAGIECARRLEAAAKALNAYLSACNACNDASASLDVQGKGRDGRAQLVRDCSEYANYLSGIYEP